MKRAARDCMFGLLALAISLLVLLIPISPAHAQWTAYNLPDPGWVFDKIHFISSNEGWAIGRASDVISLFHYFNGKWTAVAPPGDVWQLNGLHFSSPDEGWVVGCGGVSDYTASWGVLWHYSYGSWTVAPPPDISTSWELVGVHFGSPSEGWAVGNDWENSRVVLLHYLDGTWTSVPPPTLLTSQGDLSADIHFTSSDEGWVVGSEGDWTGGGVFLHYLNGSWTAVNPPKLSLRWNLSHVHFTSPNEGWAVGVDSIKHKGVLLHYHNGRWKRVKPPKVSSDWDLYAVHFISPKEGWAVGYDWNNGDGGGVLLHYLNGTWKYVNPLDLTTGWHLNDVHFVSPNEGWAVGNGGVLKYFVPPPDLTGEWKYVNTSCNRDMNDRKCSLGGRLHIQNTGGQDVKAALVKFYLSSDNILDEGVDTIMGEVSTGKIKSGASVKKSLYYSFPANEITLANYVIAVIDTGNTVSENNEGNNRIVSDPLEFIMGMFLWADPYHRVTTGDWADLYGLVLGGPYHPDCPALPEAEGFCMEGENLTSGKAGIVSHGYRRGDMFGVCLHWWAADFPLVVGHNLLSVSAYDSEGNFCRILEVVTKVLLPPTELSVTPGDGQNTITWNDVPEATSYNIYWSKTYPVTKTSSHIIQNVLSPYVHSGLTNGETLYYAVSAVGGNAEGDLSKTVFGTPG